MAICARDGSVTLAGVRDELATSRKYAQALLEHLDSKRDAAGAATPTCCGEGGAPA